MNNNSRPSEEHVMRTLQLMQSLIYCRESEHIINEVKNRDIVIFLGNTRSGKSTVVNYVIGNDLKAIRIRKNIYRLVKLNESSLGPRIGEGSTSETTIPSKWTSSNMSGLVVDAPGFDDNRGEAQDVANAFYIKELITNATSVKFVLISDINDILSDNISHFTNFIDKIYTMLPQCNYLQRGMIVIFTKDREDTSTREICEYLRDKIIRQENIQVKNRSLINYFTNRPEAIAIFKMPEADGVLHGHVFGDMLGTIERGAEKLYKESLSNVTPGISDKSRCFLLEAHAYFTELQDFTEILKTVDDRFTTYLQKYEIDENFLSNNEMNEIKSKLRIMQDEISAIMISSMNVKELLGYLHNILPNDASLSEGSNIYMKLKFIQFVDQVLQIEESSIFRVKIMNTLSSMRSKIVLYYVKAQEKTLEITKKEAESKCADIEKEREKDREDFKNKMKSLEERNEALMRQQREDLGFFGYLGKTVDSLISKRFKL